MTNDDLLVIQRALLDVLGELNDAVKGWTNAVRQEQQAYEEALQVVEAVVRDHREALQQVEAVVREVTR
jgi:hypothetical protein